MERWHGDQEGSCEGMVFNNTGVLFSKSLLWMDVEITDCRWTDLISRGSDFAWQANPSSRDQSHKIVHILKYH